MGKKYPNSSPEDNKNRLKQFTPEQVDSLIKLVKNQFLEAFLKTFRICSFCATATNPLVWSHYSDSHKGFCLVFDTKSLSIGLARKVCYQAEYPTFDISDIADHEKMDVDKIIRQMALIKYTDWGYEQEYRFIRSANNTMIAQGKLKFSPEALKAVIFGCLISEDDKKLIKEWCHNRKNKIEFREAKPSDTAYKLEIEVLGTT